MTKSITVWVLRAAGFCFLGACVLFLVRGRGFSVMGIPNPPPLWCLSAGAGSMMAAYLLQEKGPSRKHRVANLALMSFSFLLLGAVGEYGIRLFLQRTQGFNSVQQMFNPNPDGNLPTDSHHPLLVITRLSADKRLIYELQPGLDRKFGHKILRTNQAGMREDKDFALQKPEGTVRILGLGDSGMWGWSLDQGQGYMEVLEANLSGREDLPDVEVLNLAVPGYNTYQELRALETKGLPYQPDVVVVGWCENDFMLPFFMYSRRDHFKEPGSYFLSLLINRRVFLEKVTPEVLKLGDMPEGMVAPEVMEYAGKAGVKKSLEAMRTLGETHGFRVLVFGPLKADIRKICDEAGVESLNTYDLKETDPPEECMTFYMHPRACGHEILGNFLADDLVARGWVAD